MRSAHRSRKLLRLPMRRFACAFRFLYESAVPGSADRLCGGVVAGGDLDPEGLPISSIRMLG
jgi:hypothetical protein